MDDPLGTTIAAAAAMTDDDAYAMRTRQMYGKNSEREQEKRRFAASRAAGKVAYAKGLRDELYDARGRAIAVTKRRWPGLIGAAAENAVLDAATALTLRAQIRSRGFTQAHYDTLTQPWQDVMGPAHPNDA
ncbi:hypothetical protein FM110_04480 [Brachybacterium nesterenkovii]|uniref:Uncharacterized protein n=1 Tax=Brachybacterium nesterenkovii TaxID=47847 RepID=A0A1X6WWT8_9MICO|nr:hypothetical protein FM110_04480 [Brachybacterium nesterenkovii]